MISKSGTTTEPAIAFRVFKEMMEKKYGKEEAAKRIYATTDRVKGSLKGLATEEGYESFVVPDDVGGRFSVLTAVGLLPIAVSGADIDKLMEGAAEGRRLALESEYEKNDALLYAAIRNILLRKENPWRSWPIMSPAYIMFPNGGSSCTARAKERIRRAFSRQAWI